MKFAPIRGVLLVAALALPAFAPAAENSALRTVTTTGRGIAEATADIAVVQTQTSSVNKSASAAKSAVDQNINSALLALKKLGIKQDDIIASTLRLNPEYQYNNRERTFTGYRATRDLSVSLKKLDQLDDLLETITSSGINNILSINLKSSEEDQLRAQAFKLAIADSKRKAGQLAQAYDAELGNIHTINYQSAVPVTVESGPMLAMKVAADGSGGQYIHDKITIEDSVQVVFELIIPH